MRRYDTEKHRNIVAAFKRFPQLSNRAVARLTGTSPETVGRVRAINGIATRRRVEASGRPARGQRQTVQYYQDQLPDERAALYRAFGHQELLYVGTSWVFLHKLATHGRRPWWPR